MPVRIFSVDEVENFKSFILLYQENLCSSEPVLIKIKTNTLFSLEHVDLIYEIYLYSKFFQNKSKFHPIDYLLYEVFNYFDDIVFIGFTYIKFI